MMAPVTAVLFLAVIGQLSSFSLSVLVFVRTDSQPEDKIQSRVDKQDKISGLQETLLSVTRRCT